MIIGISGKIGSGKDTVGKIIQYLASTEGLTNVAPFRDCLEQDSSFISSNSGWEIRKFADKLKDIVCFLINCTREQLEDQEFKNTPLGEEWSGYEIISNQALYLNIGHRRVFYTMEDAYKWIDTLVNFDKPRNHFGTKEIRLTPRLLLQLLGTECGRQIIHPNIWVNALFVDYKGIGQQRSTSGGVDVFYVERRANAEMINGEFFIPHHDFIPKEHHGKKVRSHIFQWHEVSNQPVYPNWIITDVRFPNEMQAIKDRGGIVIRVNRRKKTTVMYWDNKCPCCDASQQEGHDLDDSSQWLMSYTCYKCKSEYKINFGDKMGGQFDDIIILKDMTKTSPEHPSENSLDNAQFDSIIDNYGTLEELVEKVKIVYSHIKQKREI